ncbi:MAG: hypothetical protein U1E23_03300 [Reyranellaceae bacterium]
MSRIAGVAGLAAVVLAAIGLTGAAMAQSAAYTWTGNGVNVPGSSSARPTR